jgi:protein-tyrosine-phosphatase
VNNLLTWIVTAALTASTAGPALAGEESLIETLRPAARQAIAEFDRIDAKRKKDLEQGAKFISERLAQGKPADMTFICTHNSRRSHLSQIWAQTAAVYYGLPNVTTFSGGTEATACNPRTVRALRRAGFSIAEAAPGSNPVYLAQISETRAPVKMFSKKYSDSFNPQSGFLAVFSCDQAEESCPMVKGAALRLPILYVDPKRSDNTPAEEKTYDERSRQIAREMFYLMSQVRRPAAKR